MKLERLQLTNFRGFESLDLNLDPRLTVLVGENGAGKSSVIRALEIGAWGLVGAAWGERGYAQIAADDVRAGAASNEVSLHAGSISFSIAYTAGATNPVIIPKTIGDVPPLPIVFNVARAALKTSVVVGGGAQMWLRSTVTGPQPAWDDGRNGDFTSFEHLETWFRAQEDLENQERVRRQDLKLADPGLEAVRGAIKGTIPSLSDIHIDRGRPAHSGSVQLVVSKDGIELGCDQLSDGEKSLIVIASTIARRLSLRIEAEIPALEREALILIDEVELHLHPRWQREILPRLLATFTNCQFVVTTHSPQVLSSVSNESIVVLEKFKAYATGVRTKGRDSSAILGELLGTPEHPKQVMDDLESIAEAIDEEDLVAARARIDKLAELLGPSDHEIVRLRSLLTFLSP